MTKNKWRAQFIQINGPISANEIYNNELEMLKTNLSEFRISELDRKIHSEFIPANIDAVKDLPCDRLIVRTGASSSNYGYPSTARYNFRVFTSNGPASYLTAEICESLGFNYRTGDVPRDLIFEKNLQSVVYKKYRALFDKYCSFIDSKKKEISNQEYCRLYKIRSRNWKELYDVYLESMDWKEKRRQRILLDEWRCTKCGQYEDQVVLQVHHLTYKNVGDENIVDDLVTLCIDCHQEQHGRTFA
jgi:5-methylcytosine-specific restriction endonuclease McrA